MDPKKRRNLALISCNPRALRDRLAVTGGEGGNGEGSVDGGSTLSMTNRENGGGSQLE